MHDSEQLQTLRDGGDVEVFSALKMAGFEGRVKGILCERELLLERKTGHTLHLKLTSIARLKHHHSSLLPRWVLIMGLSSIYGAWRVFVGQPALALLSFGIASTLVFFLGRRPTITLDTTSGDCHIIYGNDASLMRLTYITKRLRDGASLEEARVGLELLVRENDYPSTSPIENGLVAAERPNLVAPSALGMFLSDNEEESSSLSILPAWAAEETGEPVMVNEPVYSEVSGDGRNQPASFQRAEAVRQEMRRHVPVVQQNHNPWEGQHNPQASFQSGNGINGNYNSQTHNPSTNHSPSQGGMFEGGDMFSEGGMFGEGGIFGEEAVNSEPTQFNPHPINSQQPQAPTTTNLAVQPYSPDNSFDFPPNAQPQSNRGQVNNEVGGFNSTRWQEGDSRQPALSSSEMLRQSHIQHGGLPPANAGALHPNAGRPSQHSSHNSINQPTITRPTTFINSFPPKLGPGERQNDLVGFSNQMDALPIEEVNAPPLHDLKQIGLVASARVEGAESRQQVIEAETIPDGDPLKAYPMMRKLTASRKPGSRRMKIRSSLLPGVKSGSSIRNMIIPSITDVFSRISSVPNRILRRNAGRGDGYSEVYGDRDGYANDSYAQEPFQTPQAMRVNSGQAHQSQIKNDIGRLVRANGGVLADDVAAHLLRHLSSENEPQQRLLTAGPEEIPSSFSDLSSSTQRAEGANDIPGLLRIDG